MNFSLKWFRSGIYSLLRRNDERRSGEIIYVMCWLITACTVLLRSHSFVPHAQ